MIKVKKDGRTILSGKHYTDHKLKVWEGQGRCCATCGFYVRFSEAQFDHKKGRGMGGSKRDDLDSENKVRHAYCHGLRHYRERDLAAQVM